MKKSALSLVAAACLAIFAPHSHATVVTSNLTDTPVGSGSPLMGPIARYAAFEMGADDYELGSVDLMLTGYDSGEAPQLTLWNSNPTSGGSAVLSFSVPAWQSSSDFVYNFTPGASFTLQAHTTYWLELLSPAGFMGWRAPDSNALATGVGAQGVSLGGNNYYFQVNSPTVVAAPVPEPETWALFALGAAVVAVRRRKA